MSDCRLICGDAIEVMGTLPAGSARTCITSPPYFGLRDYGVPGQIGLEETPADYVARLVDVFRAVRRVLADDGTCWVNLGDSYGSGEIGRHDARESGHSGHIANCKAFGADKHAGSARQQKRPQTGLALKQLLGIPWRVAFALQADGWILRSDIIWAKPNPMPESVRDRPTKSHEYLFLLSKRERYYYDADAVREPLLHPGQRGKACVVLSGEKWRGKAQRGDFMAPNPLGRNRRSVWTIAPRPYRGAHFAVMPEALVEPCVLAGSAQGDTVLDPFVGSGTVPAVAMKHGRKAVGIDLNAAYLDLADHRLAAARLPLRFA